jgi:hypothetical protein
MVTAPSPPDSPMRDAINSMHIKDIREELASYGVDASSIFEKKELIEALINARREDYIKREFLIEDIADDTTPESTWNPSSEDTPDLDKQNEKSWFAQGLEDMASKFNTTLKDKVRQERIKLEMKNLQNAKVQELKDELTSYGVSNKYLEKAEFVRAVAEARVDGLKKKKTVSTAGSSWGRRKEEEWDPSYKNVFVTKFDSEMLDPNDVIIDVRARQ